MLHNIEKILLLTQFNDGAMILWLKMVYLQLKHLLEFHAQGDHRNKSVYLRTTGKYLKPKDIYIKPAAHGRKQLSKLPGKAVCSAVSSRVRRSFPENF